MTWHTELYCESLDDLDKMEAIRAIHQAWIQLQAQVSPSYDNAPAIEALRRCLAAAGHPAGEE